MFHNNFSASGKQQPMTPRPPSSSSRVAPSVRVTSASSRATSGMSGASFSSRDDPYFMVSIGNAVQRKTKTPMVIRKVENPTSHIQFLRKDLYGTDEHAVRTPRPFRIYSRSINTTPVRLDTPRSSVTSRPSSQLYGIRPQSPSVIPTDSKSSSKSRRYKTPPLGIDEHSAYTFGQNPIRMEELTPEEQEELYMATVKRHPKPHSTEIEADLELRETIKRSRPTTANSSNGKNYVHVAPNDEISICNMHTIEDVVSFYSNPHRDPSVKFVYVEKVPTPLGQLYNPFRLRVIPHPSKGTSEEYIVISDATVVYRSSRGGESHVIPISSFVKEMSLFNAISKIHFFSNYLKYKAFVMWNRSIKYKHFLRTRRSIGEKLFIGRRSFCRGLIEMKKLSYELQSSQLINIVPARDGILMEQFMANIIQHKQLAGNVFRNIIGGLDKMLSMLCNRVAALANVPDFASIDILNQYFELTEEEETRKEGGRIKSVSMIQSKQNSIERMSQLKSALEDNMTLPVFIRLVDLISVETIYANGLNTIKNLADELASTSEEVKQVYFIVAINIDDVNGVTFLPTERVMLEVIKDIAEEIVTSITAVPRLIASSSFKGFFGVHTGVLPKHFSLADTLRNDSRFKESSNEMRRVISKDYDSSAKATKYFSKNIKWFSFVDSEWPKLLETWEERIQKEQSYKEIYECMTDGVSAVEFETILDKVDEAFSSVKEMYSIRRGCLIVSSLKEVEFLNKKLKEIQDSTRECLLRVANIRVDQLSYSLTTRMKLIHGRPKALHHFATFVDNLNNVLEFLVNLDRYVEHVESIFSIGEKNGFTLEVISRKGSIIGENGGKSSLYDRFIETSESAKDFRAVQLEEMINKLNKEMELEENVIETTKGLLECSYLADYTSETDEVIEYLQHAETAIDNSDLKINKLISWEILFGCEPSDITSLNTVKKTLKDKKDLWTTIHRWELLRDITFISPIVEIDFVEFSKEVDDLFTKVNTKLHPKHQSDASKVLLEHLRETKQLMPTLLHIGNKNLKTEHWSKILATTGRAYDPSISFESLKQLNLFDLEYRELISEQSVIASGEANILSSIKEVEEKWKETEFKCKTLRNYKNKFILDDVSDIVQQAEEHLLLVQGFLTSRFVYGIRGQVEEWEANLILLQQTIEEWVSVQGAWMYLEYIFSFDDIKTQLPDETQSFKEIDEVFSSLIDRAMIVKTCIPTIAELEVLEILKDATVSLDAIKMNLEVYLELKRSAFPRFYFLSNDELLAILSEVRNPKSVQPHLGKCFDNIKSLVFKTDTEVSHMVSAEGEMIPFVNTVQAEGYVEVWLQSVESAMVASLKHHTQRTLHNSQYMKRINWLLLTQNGENDSNPDAMPSQCIQAVDMVQWTLDTENAIGSSALKRYYNNYLKQIVESVDVIRKDITPLQRSLIQTLLVIDVHNRDVLETLIEQCVTSTQHFGWNMQMRYYATNEIILVHHMNASLEYSYEYLGSAKRLVITPLTDRAFLTLTQALHFNLGGAPQGPAGTGKTESVKDLGKALARQVVVFNCSDGINTSIMSRMFAGLAQTGAWACFDEFNRIASMVLSVIAQQMLEITTSIAEGRHRMVFDGHEIVLHHNFGVFITMNPGYAGRTELPDNLKSLFRPVCMMVPDYRLIAEIMFFSEGFVNARTLSVKMVQLYKLSSEQLSKQDHYDFGMRAVKSVLVMAGSIKRAEPEIDEDMLLIRAMRDSNIPKFGKADAALFYAIIQDLYPGLDLIDSDNTLLRNQLIVQSKEENLVATDAFIQKSLQLFDTITVRHGIMMVGATLTGKSAIMKNLQDSLTFLGKEHSDRNSFYTVIHQNILNPKAVTGDELYGFVNVTTHEWTDGILSNIVRSIVMEANANRDRYWIVFDGPVDAIWIENMNTVLDDNKVLCLVCGERLKIPDTVTFCFEVEDLKVASPATVSRCGMIYVEASGWFDSWEPQLQSLNKEIEKEIGNEWMSDILFEAVEQMVKPLLTIECCREFLTREWIPSVECQRVVGMVHLLHGLVMKRDVDDDEPKEVNLPAPNIDDGVEDEVSVIRVKVEGDVHRNLSAASKDSKILFRNMTTFAFIWAFGGNLNEQGRSRFSEAMMDHIARFCPTFPAIDILEGNGTDSSTLFSYCIHKRSLSWVKWSYKVPDFIYNPMSSFFDMIVPTRDSVCVKYILCTLLKQKRHILLNGTSGTGKSIALQSIMFDELETEDASSPWESFSIFFSASTTSRHISDVFDSKLKNHYSKEIHTKTIDHAAIKSMIACIDDINLPHREIYGACPPLELIRQLIVQGKSFDRKKNTFKYVTNVVIAATSGPPGRGGSEMTQRLTSRFFMLCKPTLDDDSLGKIFSSLFKGFFSTFAEEIQFYSLKVIDIIINVFKIISAVQLPTLDKAHYSFNTRDIGKVVQGIMVCQRDCIDTKKVFADLTMHEMSRVFHDRLVNSKDRTWWYKMSGNLICEAFDIPEDPEWPTMIYGDFGTLQETPVYDRMEITEELMDILDEKMASYGLQYKHEMDLVMFDDAIFHLIRVCRILRQPRGNALLVGVSGSGRQSLANLATYICGSRQFLIQTSRSYNITDFRIDLKRVLIEAGCEGTSTTLLLSENQLLDESFLEDINTLLNTGEVSAPWEADENERIVSSIQPIVLSQGKTESMNVIQATFVSRCMNNIHLVLTMSPIGSQFRRRLRMFPALVNNMTIDWYDSWPKSALISVANRVLQTVDGISHDEILVSLIGELTVHMHVTVEDLANKYSNEFRHHVYVTPTTYLSFLSMFAELYVEQKTISDTKMSRFRRGLDKLKESNDEVDVMKRDLTKMQPILEKHAIETEAFANELSKEEKSATIFAATVAQEENSCGVFMFECKRIKDECQGELDKAMPAYRQALEALNALNSKDINEARSYTSPPKKVALIMDAVLVILEEGSGWDNARKVMGKPDFLQILKNFNADAVSEKVLKKLKKFTEMDDFKPELVQNVSKACVSFCLWCRAIDNYCDILKIVKPKREKLQSAEEKLEVATKELKTKQIELRNVEAKINGIRSQYDASMVKMKHLEVEKQRTEIHMSRAERILSGLASEQERWVTALADLKKKQDFFIGSVVLSAGMITYGGYFNANYRSQIAKDWMRKCNELGVVLEKEVIVLEDLVDAVEVRQWCAHGLPKGSFTLDNGVILTKSRRWCLCIDPHGQANHWIRNMYRNKGLMIMKPTDANLLCNLELAIRRGLPVLLEAMKESIDTSLDPILTHRTFIHGGRMMITVRDQPVEYNPNFFLVMTTRMANPHYLPEVQIKTTLLNFVLTMEGLEEQLLGDVVRHEKSELEERADNLVLEIADGQSQLLSVQNRILQMLSGATGNLLEDEVLINALTQSKETSISIQDGLESAMTTSAYIDAARQEYRSVASRAAQIFYIISEKLSALEHVYQFSLAAFSSQLSQTMKETAKRKSITNSMRVTTSQKNDESIPSDLSAEVAERCRVLLSSVTYDTYCAVSRGMFEKDKTIFAFLLATSIERTEGRIKEAEWQYFLRGGRGVLVEGATDPPVDWLTDLSWEDLQFLDTVTGFPKVSRAIANNPHVWGKLFDDPWTTECHPFMYTHMSTWNKLVFMRSFKEECLNRLCKEFIKESIGAKFIESPSFDLSVSFRSSSPITPVVLILTPGTDTTAIFNEFAEHCGFGGMKHMLSLGQGQGDKAEILVNEAARSGHWVYLQNCHLYPSWMPSLEALVESLAEINPHEDFRLWLTTMPVVCVPISILQSSVKVMREPPVGLKPNFRDTLLPLTNPQLWNCVPEDQQKAWHRILFSVALFHSTIQERRRFGPLGWNVPYDWNFGDLDVSVKALREFMLSYEVIPWSAIHYLIGNINYGGRVTDQWDVRCLTAMISSFLCEDIVDDSLSSKGGAYRMPPTDDGQEVLRYVSNDLPGLDTPDLFGLNANAELAYQGRLSKALMSSVVDVQPRMTSGSGANEDLVVLDTIAELIARLPLPIDKKSAHSSTYAIGDNGTMTPLGTVVFHEADKYNKLIDVLTSTLFDLKKALSGELVMDNSLENTLESISFFIVPKLWEKAAYPSTRGLFSWFTDLNQRVDFFRDWNDAGVPSIFWLGGFIFPQGFLTGVLQAHSRQQSLPIDELFFTATVTKEYDQYDCHLDWITEGVYVHGLAMEGARWDTATSNIAESLPRQLSSKMPIMVLLPTHRHSNKVKVADANKHSLHSSSALTICTVSEYTSSLMSSVSEVCQYECPVYKIATRAGTLSTTGISTNFIVALDLSAGEESADHWVGRGTALIAAPSE